MARGTLAIPYFVSAKVFEVQLDGSRPARLANVCSELLCGEYGPLYDPAGLTSVRCSFNAAKTAAAMTGETLFPIIRKLCQMVGWNK